MSENLEPRPGDVAPAVRLYALKFCGQIRWHHIHSSPNHLRKMVMAEYLQKGSEFSWEALCQQHPEIDFQIVPVTVSEVQETPFTQPQPQPDGETVTVECAVIRELAHRAVVVGIEGMSVEQVRHRFSFCQLEPTVATVKVSIAEHIMTPEVPVLPTVNVTGH